MNKQALRWALWATGVFNVIDYWVSLRCLEQGFSEANPLLRPLVHSPWFFLIKVVLVPLGLYLIWRCRHHVQVVGTLAISWVTSIYALLMVYYVYLFVSGAAS